MHTSSVLIAITATLASLVAAQNDTSSSDDTYAVLPNSVDTNTRISWCRAQQNSCPQICGGRTAANTCNQKLLEWECECFGGSTPNISDYSQTLPGLMCEEWKAQCVKSNPDNLPGQNICLSVTCGQKNASALASPLPSKGVSSTASSTASSTSPTGSTGGSSRGSEVSSPAGGASAAPSSAAAVALDVGRQYGTGAVLGLVALAFGFAF